MLSGPTLTRELGLDLEAPDRVGLAMLALHLAFWCTWLDDPALASVLIGESALAVLALLAMRSASAALGKPAWLARLAGWWIFLAAMPIYLNLGAIMDAGGRPNMDAVLIAADQRLFGVQASLWLSRREHPVLSDYLFLAYTSYYGWIVLTGVLLAARAGERVFHGYLVAVGGTFLIQIAGYVAVPATGPRFAQAAQLGGPIHGGVITQALEAAFFRVSFVRDCFPSGHTLQTLIAVYFAAVYLPGRYAKVIAVAGASIVLATLYCRMHFAIDLCAAVPLALLGVAAGERIARGSTFVAPRAAST